MSSKFVTKAGMPITMCRMNLIQGFGPALQIAEGWTIELPDNVHKVLDDRTNVTWPTTWFVPRTTGNGAQLWLSGDLIMEYLVMDILEQI